MKYLKNPRGEKQIVGIMLLALLPCLGFGLYKNGFLLYERHLISIYAIFKPLILLGISIAIYELFYLLLKHRFGFDYEIIPYILISFIVSPNINYLTYALVILGAGFLAQTLLKKVHFNRIAAWQLIIIGIAIYQQQYFYETALESNYHFAYNTWDILMGHQIGGVASTSIIGICLGWIYLLIKGEDKKTITISGIMTFIGGTFLYLIIMHQLNLNTFLNSSVLFGLVFVAPEFKSSPITKRGMITYGGLIGLLTVGANIFFNSYDGIYLAIFIASLGLNLYEKIGNWAKFRLKLPKNKGNRA